MNSRSAGNFLLKRALSLVAGQRFIFRVEYADGKQALRKLQVVTDINGQFWVESDGGAKVAFSLNNDLLAFYNRQGPKDSFLDAYILSFAKTPLAGGDLSWEELVPVDVVPRAWLTRFFHAVFCPFTQSAQSTYKRCWDSMLGIWTQQAEHRIGSWKCSTTAQVCEDRGLREFKLQAGKKTLLKAFLLEIGVNAEKNSRESMQLNATLNKSKLAISFDGIRDVRSRMLRGSSKSMELRI